MNENIHAIIHKAFIDLSGLVQFWGTQCEAFAVAQHEADDDVPRTHCHMLIIQPIKKRNAFNEDLKKFFPGIDGRADFRLNVKTQKDKLGISRQGLWYLLKGDKNALKFQKNFSELEVEEALKHFDPGQAKREPIPKTKKETKTQFEIVEEIREQLQLSNTELVNYTSDVTTTQHNFKHTYDNIMNTILTTLDKYKIKTGMYDIERWFITVVRVDTVYRESIKAKIFSKLSL
jgi:hypothetical protein